MKKKKTLKQKKNKFNSSDFSVSDSTLVLLKKEGYLKLKDRIDENIQCWDGKKWVFTRPIYATKSSKNYKVLLSNGRKIICASTHKWPTSEGVLPTYKLKRVQKFFLAIYL